MTPARILLRGSDWPALRQQGRAGGYTMKRSNSGVSILAVFICDESIHEAPLEAVEHWLRNTSTH